MKTTLDKHVRFHHWTWPDNTYLTFRSVMTADDQERIYQFIPTGQAITPLRATLAVFKTMFVQGFGEAAYYENAEELLTALEPDTITTLDQWFQWYYFSGTHHQAADPTEFRDPRLKLAKPQKPTLTRLDAIEL